MFYVTHGRKIIHQHICVCVYIYIYICDWMKEAVNVNVCKVEILLLKQILQNSRSNNFSHGSFYCFEFLL